jgi:hypothetical protein
MIGDAGSPEFYANVDATDQIQARLNQGAVGPPTGILNLFDFNRDALVDATDQIIARNNQGAMPWLALTAPPSAPEAAGVPEGDGSGAAIASALAGSKSSVALVEVAADVLLTDEADDASAPISAAPPLAEPAGAQVGDDDDAAAVDLALEELFVDEELLDALVG